MTLNECRDVLARKCRLLGREGLLRFEEVCLLVRTRRISTLNAWRRRHLVSRGCQQNEGLLQFLDILQRFPPFDLAPCRLERLPLQLEQVLEEN